VTEAERLAAPLLVGAGTRFDGLLHFNGIAVVDGELSGEVVAQGTLVLGVGARVTARIEVDQLISAGWSSGDVVARQRIELAESAEVHGVLRTPRLRMADGCRMAARCHTGADAETADSKANSPPSAA